ncbi:ribonuclease E/G [Amphibacillus sp. MSJ-3]|uniref:ribonuclease E/G n=1 Tax=Amphibacillus sp. MSJ-3 TaxID=2841505 RepID=UPI001C0E9108|nr:ribonuclease E/G [Amphibacillus sp. MSJ-3]MBU5593592.1 ribonuclease E/G [Amphibacillus sp. MSJ-3]
MLDLIISTKATEKLGMAVKDNQLIELAVDRPDAPQLVGSIFLGKIINVDQGLQAAFVDIGLSQLAYLEKGQIPDSRKDGKKSIESWLYEGQTVIVQVIKDAYQDKGARLTMNIAIANQVLVYLPFGNYLAASKKLTHEEEKTLKSELGHVCQGEEGLIIRTQAKQFSVDALIHQVEQLRAIWRELLLDGKKMQPPKILRLDHTVTDRFIRRFPFCDINHIVCDQVSTVKQIKKRYPELETKVKWNQQLAKDMPIPIEESIQQLLNPVVHCEHGVTIVIDQTEALTVIDVNSSGFTGKTNQQNFAYKVNCIAVDEIAKQIRLRNLSGMIVIDFIRMKNKNHKAKINERLSRACQMDPTRVEIYGFTRLGLFEITRKRETPIHHMVFANPRAKEITFSQVSKVYALERELLASQDQAVIVEVTRGFHQEWDQWIDRECFLNNSRVEVYFIETKGVRDYQIRRSGTEQLIAEYLEENKQLSIDKIN